MKEVKSVEEAGLEALNNLSPRANVEADFAGLYVREDGNS
jgi:hypothetical protein